MVAHHRGVPARPPRHPREPDGADLAAVRAYSRPSRDRPTAVDLFCGAGGLSAGLERAGFDVLVGADSDEWAVRTHDANLPGLSWCGDLSDPSEFLTTLDVWGLEQRGPRRRRRAVPALQPRRRVADQGLVVIGRTRRARPPRRPLVVVRRRRGAASSGGGPGRERARSAALERRRRDHRPLRVAARARLPRRGAHPRRVPATASHSTGSG